MQYFDGLMTSRPVLFLLVILACLTHSVQADQIPDAQSDCGEVDIRYSDDPTLTRSEKIQLMEKAFFDSLSRFEMCNLSNERSDTSAQDNASAAGVGASAQGAVASSELQGTDAPEASAAPSSSAEAFADDTLDNDNLEAPPRMQSRTAGSGAIPDDIPPANNDDAIAAQIRLAAERETDPEIQKKLWNEYRKYKGLKIEQ